MKKSIIFISSLFFLCCSIENDNPPDPSVPWAIDCINTTMIRPLYLSHCTPALQPIPYIQIIELSNMTKTFYYWLDEEHGGGGRDYRYLIDSFTLRFYDSDIINDVNWQAVDQQEMVLSNFESYVYYSLTITNGLNMPELFQSGNSLPFYIMTNGGLLQYFIKELHTNR